MQSPPFLKSERLDFKGKSLRIQWCFKALFVIGFIKDKVLCSSKYFIRVPGNQASDRGWIVGIFGEVVDEKNNNGNFTDFSVLWNGLWFFQLGQFVRDTGRWNFLPLVNCRDSV